MSGKRVYKRAGAIGNQALGGPFEAAATVFGLPAREPWAERLDADAMEHSIQQRFQSLMENVSDVVWVMGPHLRFLYISPSVRDLLGVAPERIMDDDPFLWVPQESRDWVRSVFASKLERGAGDLAAPLGPTTLEMELENAEGVKVPVEVRMNALRDGTGRAAGLLGVARDVTERKQAEIVREAQRKVAEAASSSDNLLTLCRQVRANLSALTDTRNFCIAVRETAGGAVSMPFSCSEQSRGIPGRLLQEAFRLLDEGGRSLLLTGDRMRALCPGEEGLPACLVCVPFRMSGEAAGCIAVCSFDRADALGRRDVTMLEFVSDQVAMAVERLKAIEELRMSEQQFRGFVERSTIGLGLFDLDGRPIYRNSTLFQMLDLTEESAAQYNLFSDPLVPPGCFDAIRRGETVSFEVRIDFDRTEGARGGRKGIGWILKTLSEIRSPLTPRGGYLVQVQDISTLRRTEMLFRTLNEASSALRGLRTEQEVLAAVGWVLSQAGIAFGVLVPVEEGVLGVRYLGVPEGGPRDDQEVPGLDLSSVRMNISAMPGLRDLLRGGSPVFLDDFGAVGESLDPRRAKRFLAVARAMGARPALAVPLFAGDSVEGILSVHARDLTADDSLAVMAFANSVGSAILACRLRAGAASPDQPGSPRPSSPRRARAGRARR